MRTKTKKIIFRVDEVLYDFLHKIAEANDITVSEMNRKILEYFFIGYMIGEFRRPLKELRHDLINNFDFMDLGDDNNTDTNKN